MKTFAIAASLALAMLATSASAAVLTWTFQDVTFEDGGSLTGSFDYDDVTDTVVDWDFATTGGSSLPGFHYDTSNSHLVGMNVWGLQNSFLIARTTPFAQPYTNLAFASSLGVAGSALLNTSANLDGSWECNNCLGIRYITGGSVTTGAVPEPAAWALLIMGFGAAGASLRRRRAVAA